MSADESSPAPARGSTIASMPVYVDPSVPVHPLTVDVVMQMVEAGILDEDARIELLDGVLVEMSGPSPPHAFAVRRLNAIVLPIAASAGMELSIQDSLDVGSSITLPQPDLAVVPATSSDRLPAEAVLVVEIAKSSLAIDLGRKADIYAAAGVPDYWVLDVEGRVLVVHREPANGRYTRVRHLDEHDTISAMGLDLTLPVAALLS